MNGTDISSSIVGLVLLLGSPSIGYGRGPEPPQVEGNIPSPLEYPELDSLVEGRPPPSKEQQREVLGVEFVPAPKHTSKDVFGKMAKGKMEL